MSSPVPPPFVLHAPRGPAVAEQWAAMHQVAQLVASLAGLAEAGDALAAAPCPPELQQASGWRLGVINNALADTAAILAGGIRALLAARAAGAPTTAAAEALWQEFVGARRGLMGLAGAG